MPEETLQLSDDRGFWFAVVDIEVIKDQALSLTDKAIYAILCAFSSVGDNRSSRPSIGTIAELKAINKEMCEALEAIAVKLDMMRPINPFEYGEIRDEIINDIKVLHKTRGEINNDQS